MKSLLLAIIAALMTASAASSPNDTSGVYWVFFKDKGPDKEPRLVDIQKTLSRRTILRRQKALHSEIVVDTTDLSVFALYKDSLGYLVSSLRRESRWLNAVSVVMLAGQIDGVKSLPFVSSIMPVRRSNPNSTRIEQVESWEAGEDSYALQDASLDYGASFRQLEQIGVIWAHEQGYHGEGILVCFLDTGFLTYHHSLNQMDIVAEHDFIHDDDFVGFDQVQDLPGQPNHGTATLSTIGGYYPGELIGPAFAASYILCKTEETGSETAVEEDYYVAALEWGEMLGADLASSSLTYSDWYTIDDYNGQTCLTTVAANIAFQKGMILCSSMGNEGPGKFTLGAPADSRYSLGIGAVNSDGLLAGFSSWGPTADGRIKPDVCAQGVSIIAATPYTTDGFSKWNGTSLSCPLAAGVVALVIQAHPDWDPSLVKDAVRETSDRAERPDIRYGWGLVNAEDAINYPSISGYATDEQTGQAIVPDISLRLKVDYPDETFQPGQLRPYNSGRCDSAGFFQFVNLDYGDYLIVLTSDGYDTAQASLSIPPSQEFDVRLKRR